MSRVEDEVAALRTLVVLLLQEMKKVTARAEAYRVLLIYHGVFSTEEFEKTEKEALAEWDRALNAAFQKAMTDAIDANWKKLLETHEGPPQ